VCVITNQVINLADTMALSANFVDATNGRRAVQALRDEGLNDPAANNNAQALDEALARSRRQQRAASARGPEIAPAGAEALEAPIAYATSAAEADWGEADAQVEETGHVPYSTFVAAAAAFLALQVTA
jgi:hypothetical protein